jgi:hypothetical protein
MNLENQTLIDVEVTEIDTPEPESIAIERWYSAAQVQRILNLNKSGLQKAITKLTSIYEIDIKNLRRGGAWAGCEVVGGGMDYAAIDAKLEWFAAEVRRCYKIIETQPNPMFQPLTLCCDEFTNWAGRCSAASEFFQSALSDIRGSPELMV